MALIQNDIDWQTKLGEYQDKAYDLYVNDPDWDGAVHWSHYNGVFSALRNVLTDGGAIGEELLQSYIDAVDEFLAELDDEEDSNA